MAAQSILNFVAIFPNLDYDFSIAPNDFSAVDPSMSYYDSIHGESNIVTISTNSAVPSPIQGLLYVPDLDPEDQCTILSSQYIPSNVTRQANLPSTDYNIIALAPWINDECTKSYLASAELDPIRAFIFYHPDNKTTLPPANDTLAWSLSDGGSWKEDNRWPIYGVAGAVGHRMMAASSKYSGNLTSVPNGNNLSTRYDSRDYVRIYTQITTDDTASIPRLWLFLSVILACLIVILTFMSLTWHWLQRQRRESLRRRVANGGVDLEALGIKRLTVPKEFIDKLPLYVYTCEDDSARIASPRVARLSMKRDTFHSIQNVDDSGHDLNFSLPSPPLSSFPHTEPFLLLPNSTIADYSAAVAHNYQPNYQPACTICLDEFESSITIIRELSCGHIFHPECIDTFLTLNSSLCPMCRKSVFPHGYCPAPITNAMVRSERMVRHIRSRISVEIDENDTTSVEALRRRLLQFGRRIANPLKIGSQSNLELRFRDTDNRAVQLLEA